MLVLIQNLSLKDSNIRSRNVKKTLETKSLSLMLRDDVSVTP
jgi:hypothetical protein